jgi:PDZ domain-containing protein
VTLFAGDRTRIVKRRRGARIGWSLLLFALLGTVIFAMVPAPYVIEQPGEVFDTLGTVKVQNKTVPLISIPSQTTYPTSGSLDMLTVQIMGGPGELPNWFDVASAWLNPSEAVLPVDEIYPPGETIQDSNKQGAIDMANSQKDAVAAALTTLGYTLPSQVTVQGLTTNSPSKGKLKTGDVIVSAGGVPVSDVTTLRDVIAKAGTTKPLDVVVLRGGQQTTVQVTPTLSATSPKIPIVGILASISYTYPFDVKIQLQNVGGPSAGQMFALGIIDKLTPGSLTGGQHVAGTGTIDGNGTIGPIGGIRQKLYGAERAGATWFLAPQSNCDEVTGHVPSGIKVLAVKTLKDSLADLKVISAKGDTSALATCPAS